MLNSKTQPSSSRQDSLDLACEATSSSSVVPSSNIASHSLGKSRRSAAVFLPGTLCDAQVFAPQIQALCANSINTLVVDFGQANTLQKMLDALELQLKNSGYLHITLVAFSMGAMVAFELLRQSKKYVFSIEQLILISSNALSDSPQKAKMRQQHLAIARNTSIGSLVANTYMPNYLYKQHIGHQHIIVGMAESLGINVFVNQLAVLAQRPDSSAQLKALRMRCCIVAGRQDVLCPVDEQLRMLEAAKLSHQAVELVILEECGHFASLEQAQHINQLLLSRISTQP